MAHLPDEPFLAPTRAAQDEPEPITPTDEDAPTPELEGMGEAQADQDTEVDLDGPDLPVDEDDVADALADAGEDA